MDNRNNDVMSVILAKLNKIEDKLDKQDDKLASIDKTLVKQEGNLQEHMRRTALLEEDLKPVKKHVAMVNGVLKFIGILGTLAGIYKLLN